MKKNLIKYKISSAHFSSLSVNEQEFIRSVWKMNDAIMYANKTDKYLREAYPKLLEMSGLNHIISFRFFYLWKNNLKRKLGKPYFKPFVVCFDHIDPTFIQYAKENFMKYTNVYIRKVFGGLETDDSMFSVYFTHDEEAIPKKFDLMNPFSQKMNLRFINAIIDKEKTTKIVVLKDLKNRILNEKINLKDQKKCIEFVEKLNIFNKIQEISKELNN
jgi:hypothetical protein